MSLKIHDLAERYRKKRRGLLIGGCVLFVLGLAQLGFVIYFADKVDQLSNDLLAFDHERTLNLNVEAGHCVPGDAVYHDILAGWFDAVRTEAVVRERIYWQQIMLLVTGTFTIISAVQTFFAHKQQLEVLEAVVADATNSPEKEG